MTRQTANTSMARKTSGLMERGVEEPNPARRARLTPCPDPCHEKDASKGSGDVLTSHTDWQMCATALPKGRNPEGILGSRRDTGIQRGHWDPEGMGPSQAGTGIPACSLPGMKKQDWFHPACLSKELLTPQQNSLG